MNGFFKDIKTIERIKEGLLGRYIDLYAEQLRAEGYTRKSGSQKLRLIDDFSQWLECEPIEIRQLQLRHIHEYLRSCKLQTADQIRRGDFATLNQLFQLLRQLGVIAEPLPQRKQTPSEKLLADYDEYLRKERSLAVSTRSNYLPFIHQFLVAKFGAGPIDLLTLCASDIIRFIQQGAKRFSIKQAQMLTTAMRSFLRYTRYHGELTLDLAACVPSVTSWSLSTLPKSLPPAQVEQVLAHCDRNTSVGRRNYAILLLLARLGLRAGEVVNLTLDDIHWETGRLTIRGKMGRVDQLPLPADVGEAIVAYLKNGRPPVLDNRRLFLRAKAPLTGLKGPQALSTIVRRALERAGIESPRKGAHLFRHTLASEMLRQGHSLREIGEILRHRSPETTAIYAKVDILTLRSLALPWPGGSR